jgi:hypothetical protein
MESKTHKKIFFLLALPRSGNTLFGSIMNQNPDIAVTANSITLEIMKDVFLLKQTDVFKNYPDHKSLDNVFLLFIVLITKIGIISISLIVVL